MRVASLNRKMGFGRFCKILSRNKSEANQTVSDFLFHKKSRKLNLNSFAFAYIMRSIKQLKF